MIKLIVSIQEINAIISALMMKEDDILLKIKGQIENRLNSQENIENV